MSSQVAEWWRQQHALNPTEVPNPFLVQERVLEEVENLSDHKLLLVNQARQIGMSTAMRMEIAYRLLHHKKTRIGVTCLGSNVMKWFEEVFPPDPVPVVSLTKKEMVLANGSKVCRIDRNLDLHSRDLDLLWIDNAAWTWANETSPAEFLYRAKKVVMVSNPNKNDGTFYDLVTSGYHRTLVLPWYTRPGRDREWYNHQMGIFGTLDLASKELNCLFT